MIRTRMLRTKAPYAVVAVVLLALPYQLGSYWMHVADVAGIYALLALGLTVTLGVAGQVNLAQVAFYSVGAYTSAILTTHGWSFWAAAVLSIMAAGVIGLIVSIPALRVQSHYLGIVTLGLALAVSSVVTNASVTGGAEGLSNLPVPSTPGVDLSNDYYYYYLEVVVLIFCIGWATFIIRTRLGRRLRAMRDDHLAAASMGAETPYLRMTAFLLGGLFGGVAGVLYAGLIRFVSPDSFNISTMFFILAGVIIGGRFSLLGSMVGAILLVVLRELLSDYANYAQIVYGALVVFMVVFAPTGLAGIPSRVGEFTAHRISRRRGSQSDIRFGARPYAAIRTQERRPDLPAETALSIDGVTKRFRGLTALDDVSITVPAGEIRGIVGPNGSGKTTLFNVISGLYKPTSGRVSVFDIQTTGATAYRLAQVGVARTFQNLRLFNRLTVRDNILVALDSSRTIWAWRYLVWPFGVIGTDHAMRATADSLLEHYGLGAVAETLPHVLSYGTQRRVEIARAMARRPRLLLLDEPAAGLNGEEIRQLSEIVRDVRADGVTVVLIEHNMGMVMSLCDRVSVLSNGAVIADGPPATIAADQRVIEAYLGGSTQGPAPIDAEVAP